jgi:hypothetical protein
MIEHTDTLMEQLDAYREYLDAVRAKVGQSHTNSMYLFRKPRGSHRFTHTQLEKDGVIIETRGIPQSKRGSINYTLQCTGPGVFTIAISYKGTFVRRPTPFPYWPIHLCYIWKVGTLSLFSTFRTTCINIHAYHECLMLRDLQP